MLNFKGVIHEQFEAWQFGRVSSPFKKLRLPGKVAVWSAFGFEPNVSDVGTPPLRRIISRLLNHVWYVYLHLVDFYGKCR